MTAGSDANPPPDRPPRPARVELAAAILIVGGLVGIVGTLVPLVSGAAVDDPFLLLGLGLNLASMAVGAVLRTGRLWLVALNYAAVVAFLDLLGGSRNPASLMLGLGELVVVVILLADKPWFDAIGEWRTEIARAPLRSR